MNGGSKQKFAQVNAVTGSRQTGSGFTVHEPHEQQPVTTVGDGVADAVGVRVEVLVGVAVWAFALAAHAPTRRAEKMPANSMAVPRPPPALGNRGRLDDLDLSTDPLL